MGNFTSIWNLRINYKLVFKFHHLTMNRHRSLSCFHCLWQLEFLMSLTWTLWWPISDQQKLIQNVFFHWHDYQKKILQSQLTPGNHNRNVFLKKKISSLTKNLRFYFSFNWKFECQFVFYVVKHLRLYSKSNSNFRSPVWAKLKFKLKT